MGSFIFRLENRQKRKIGTEVSFLLFPHDYLFLALSLYSDILSPFLVKNVLCYTRCNHPHKKYYQNFHYLKGYKQSPVKICDVSIDWGGQRKRNSSVGPNFLHDYRANNQPEKEDDRHNDFPHPQIFWLIYFIEDLDQEMGLRGHWIQPALSRPRICLKPIKQISFERYRFNKILISHIFHQT